MTTSELQDLILMLRSNGVTDFEQGDLKIKLRPEQQAPLKQSREEAVARLPDNISKAISRMPAGYQDMFDL